MLMKMKPWILLPDYCLHNDVSEREFQMERGGTWDKGKGCDTFAPMGPCLVTQDEINDVVICDCGYM